MDFLKSKFGDRIISRKAKIQWPACSPDLSPLDAFYWGAVEHFLRKKFRTAKFNSISEMVKAVNDVATNCITEEMIRKGCRNCFRTRMELVVQENGGHIEHLLKSSK